MNTGVIRGVVNQGTIIGLTIEDDKTHETRTYFGDHRPTLQAIKATMIDTECKNPVGMHIAYSVESWGGLAFIGPPEIADEG